jgi:hypothetical protein
LLNKPRNPTALERDLAEIAGTSLDKGVELDALAKMGRLAAPEIAIEPPNLLACVMMAKRRGGRANNLRHGWELLLGSPSENVDSTHHPAFPFLSITPGPALASFRRIGKSHSRSYITNSSKFLNSARLRAGFFLEPHPRPLDGRASGHVASSRANIALIRAACSYGCRPGLAVGIWGGSGRQPDCADQEAEAPLGVKILQSG